MNNRISRRVALKTMAAAAGATSLPLPAFAQKAMEGGAIRLGIIADLHGGLAVDASSRLDAFLKDMREESLEGLVQMGDFAFPNDKHQHYADRFNAAHQNTLHVIGNHEFDHGLTREDCYSAWGMSSSYYSRDIGELRILVLDGNDEGSPIHKGGYPSYIGEQQQRWLTRQLEKSEKPMLVLSHQPLSGGSAVDNASEIQEILSKYSDKIILCLNGHTHIDSLVQIGGVSYLHFNSASYFWVGGKTRMAYYADPLYSIMTIDRETATVSVLPKATKWRDKSPEEIGYFEQQGRPPKHAVTPQIRPHHISKSER